VAGDDSLLAAGLLGIGEALWLDGKVAEATDTIYKSIGYHSGAGLEGRALLVLSNIYDDQGMYEKALETVDKAYRCYIRVKDSTNMSLTLIQIGSLYHNTGDQLTALSYFKKAKELIPLRGNYPFRELNIQLGELYLNTPAYDSAIFFFTNAFIGNHDSKIAQLDIGKYYILKEQYDSALDYLTKAYSETADNEEGIRAKILLALGNIHMRRNDPGEALRLTEKSLDNALAAGARQSARDAYQQLSSIYGRTGNSEKAFQYYKEYVRLKDSVVSEQFKVKLYDFRQKADNERQHSQLLLLTQQRNSLITGVLLLLMLSLITFMYISVRNKNNKLKILEQSAKYEMQALQAQMNPHFMFNSLNSINNLILNKETIKASEYLTRFSRLLRMLLMHADKATITLEEEVSMLELYLKMEQLRFTDAFDYSIQCDAGISPSSISVPPFIIQPFCENAIWHGLLHKEGKGHLKIDILMKGDAVHIYIEDDGVGRARAAEIESAIGEKKMSYGIKLTSSRISTFNKNVLAGEDCRIADVKDANDNTIGTIVELRINNQLSYDQRHYCR